VNKEMQRFRDYELIMFTWITTIISVLFGLILTFVIIIREKPLSTDQSVPQDRKEVSQEIVYQEMYQEMRRHRDHELTSSTWYNTILLAIIVAVTEFKFGISGVSPSALLMQNWLFKFGLSFVLGVLAFGNMYSVWYSSKQYHYLRNWVNRNLEPSWKKFDPLEMEFTPYHVIIFTQFSLFIAAIIIIWIPIANLISCNLR
jgi:hypothetical protein